MSNNPRRSSRTKTPKKAQWKGFVNISLSSVHKQSIKDNLLSDKECYEFLNRLAGEGYKIGIVCEPTTNTFTVSVTQQYDNLPMPGYAFSMRHKDLETAISAIRYVHVEMADDGNWDNVGSITSEDDW